MIQRRLQIHGHRGSGGTHPENTIPAFEEGARAGCDYLELDLHLSSDDVPFVHHDPRLPGTPAPFLRAMNADELAKKGVLRFEEALQWRMRSAPAVGFNVEIKMESPTPGSLPSPERFAEIVLGLMKKYRALALSIVQSFDHRVVTAARAIEPRLKTACLFEKGADFAAVTRKAGAEIAAPHFPLVTPHTVQLCHEQGIAVVPWTVNEPAEWQRLVAAGVDGLITDFPRRLIAFLSDR